ncbi:hypothetical protein GUITHDRAFT_118953 [Guillardia theta CCMP2712]|uniref:Uncharacterized protein n=1 Tax=Guillardia theta (strain CCMP2712) TaxID=905079 RepID=L1IF82_GUITC|nr:hypothetical protein GUITHDRAFT_118953 [Guillardia theta CCMP2712]EKX34911.1 hypothetical protein GUITHDRAFT_118953 [Guillardia theta CCMP2712]|eukprot:XP_005821891.1 hypothetical protein GUITHDRAFT_118953 [Guillardia theta CCMP2712]
MFSLQSLWQQCIDAVELLRRSSEAETGVLNEIKLETELERRLRLLHERERRVESGVKDMDGFKRMQRCRDALSTLDRKGWPRSFHQKEFHDDFLRACARLFWKTEPKGQFNRDHQKILELNGWDHLAQEILVSTPRRFGKTISVSMFAAAIIFSAPSIEVSIYSTCKRISQKLLNNIRKFLHLIYEGMDAEPFKVIRSNMEEIVLKGDNGSQDVRLVNSYPSKVMQCGSLGFIYTLTKC